MNQSLNPDSQAKLKQFFQLGVQHGCPKDQILNFSNAGILPSRFILKRCQHLIECLPYLQHDPDCPGDVLKSNINEEGTGGDDPADALRYLVAFRPPTCCVVKLTGW